MVLIMAFNLQPQYKGKQREKISGSQTISLSDLIYTVATQMPPENLSPGHGKQGIPSLLPPQQLVFHLVIVNNYHNTISINLNSKLGLLQTLNRHNNCHIHSPGPNLSLCNLSFLFSQTTPTSNWCIRLLFSVVTVFKDATPSLHLAVNLIHLGATAFILVIVTLQNSYCRRLFWEKVSKKHILQPIQPLTRVF